MRFLFALAWRNIRYYKGRSVTTFLLTFFSALLFIVYVAFMDGSHESMLRSSLNIYTGAMQLQGKLYRDEGGYDNLITDASGALALVEQTKGVSAASARLETFGIAATQLHSSAMMLTGIDFKAEARVSELKHALLQGDYESKGLCIYMGSALAERLHVKLHDEISFIGSAVDRSFVAELFEVCGLFRTGMYDFDLQSAFMNRTAFDTVFHSENMASVIAISVDDLSRVPKIASDLRSRVPETLRLYTWDELLRALLELLKVDSIFGYVSMGLFFLVIFFVIMIYGFINAGSRIREFGTLQSIGMQAREIDMLLLFEMLLITLIALLIATPLGAFVAWYFELHPIIVEGIAESYKEYGIVSDAIPTRYDLFTVFWNSGVILLLNLASIIYPIRYVRGFTPTEAMRHV